MQKWLISADTKKFNHEALFARDGYINWEQHANYNVGDIVYIYAKKPIGKIMFKTIVEKDSLLNDNNQKYARLRLLKQVDNDELSLEYLKEFGLTIPPQRVLKFNGELQNYIEKYFENDEIIKENKMWFVSAGENGVKINSFEKNNFVAIGWFSSDLNNKDKNEIDSLYSEQYSNEDNRKKGQAVSQINLFVNEIEIGDYIISSDSSNRSYLIGKCTSDYYFSEKKDDDINNQYKHCRDVKWLGKIDWNDVSKQLSQSKSVSEIKNKLKDEVFECYISKFIETDEKRNKIYFGAPGTGKSYRLNNNKNDMLGEDFENNFERVTFHPDYTYSNFVGTYKPTPKKDENGNNLDDITYKYVPGPFMRILVKALKNPFEPFILIIEEINRANIAAVFGDVFQLLDREDNIYISEYSISASEDVHDYLKENLDISNIPQDIKNIIKIHWNCLLGENFDKITIPSNLFIWATMNSADQGVFPMDTAFKRRWDFEYLSINDYGESNVENLKVKLNNEEILWNDIRIAINEKLLTFGINEDKLMGPFFAFKEFIESGWIPGDKFNEIFLNKIVMYLFEDAARSKRDVLFNINDETTKNVTFSQIRKAFNGKKGIEIFTDDVNNKIFNKEDE